MLKTKTLSCAVGLLLASAGANTAVAAEADAFSVGDAAPAAIASKPGVTAKIDPALQNLESTRAPKGQQPTARLKSSSVADQLSPAAGMTRVQDGKVLVDAVAAGDAGALLADLVALGLEDGAAKGNVVSGWLPTDAVDDAGDLPSMNFIRASAAMQNAGIVTDQSDIAIETDLARARFGVDGSGVRVGAMSDSYDCLGGAAGDQASGDLPSDVIVLDNGPCPGSDEGRAMMQIVRDLAPGASQAFHTAFNGQADFADGIIELANVAGSDIVVDDIIYFAEPMFQDGIIAQAVDTVVDQGVAYFSSAGNNARDAYESEFRSSGVPGVFGGDRHDFDPGPGVDDLQNFILGTGTTTFSFQWDQPYASVSGAPGSASDLDIVLYLADGTFIGLGGFSVNLGGDPIETFGVTNSGPPVEVALGIELFSGPAPTNMKYVFFGSGAVVDFPTDSGTVFGHANAAGAAAIGAARYTQTPPFGVNPPQVEGFSSAGPTAIHFDVDGNRLATPEVRQKPEVTSSQGGNNTFFGFDFEGDGFPNFFGTSAAAPTASAVAALMLDTVPGQSPDRIYGILQDTAIDMDDPATAGFDTGFDFGTGFGLVNGPDAVLTSALVRNGRKVQLCHKNRKTLTVSINALNAHLGHGDTLGICD